MQNRHLEAAFALKHVWQMYHVDVVMKSISECVAAYNLMLLLLERHPHAMVAQAPGCKSQRKILRSGKRSLLEWTPSGTGVRRTISGSLAQACSHHAIFCLSIVCGVIMLPYSPMRRRIGLGFAFGPTFGSRIASTNACHTSTAKASSPFGTASRHPTGIAG